MTEPKMTLEIRHKLFAMLDGRFKIVETFGGQRPAEWIVPDRRTADALIVERRDLLKEMIASISAEARQAVEDARHIDNLKAGNA